SVIHRQRHAILYGPQTQASKQILGIREFRHNRHWSSETELPCLGVHESQGGKILQGKPDRIKDRDLVHRLAARLVSRQHVPERRYWKVTWQLLDFALFSCLRFELDKYAALFEHQGV